MTAGSSTAQGFQALLLGPWPSIIGDNQLGALETKPNRDDLGFVKALLEAGQVTPVIDRNYSLCEVPEAIRYLEEGHARGKVVITVQHSNKA